MLTLAIDPGVKHLGAALFVENTLSYSGLIQLEDLAELLFQHGPPDSVVVELPQVYARSKSKGDPNDLIAVALVVGRLLERFPGHIALVQPRRWKGTVDKAVMLKRIASKLSPEETGLVPKLPKTLVHNVFDAIGIGLWTRGRLSVKKHVDKNHAKR